MDLPKPPDEPDLKNIIDKLANFVARNGPEFEQMTKQKQKDNKRFSFLFGGEHFNYYQYKVTTEQVIMKQQSIKQQQQQPQLGAATQQMPGIAPPSVVIPATSQPPPGNLASWSQNPPQLGPSPHSQQVREQLEQSKSATQEQVKQSEANLAAQYTSLMQQRQSQIEEAISRNQDEELQKLMVECSISADEFDAVLTPITESCTKEAISNGKSWIFAHNISEKHSQLLVLYLKKQITATDVTFQKRLFLIYLINDVLHHCMRKNADDLRKAFETVVTPIFCAAHSGAAEDQQQKLVKLLNLWEQNKYFSAEIIQELSDPGGSAMTNYYTRVGKDLPTIVTQITQAANARYASLQKQHQEFVNHLNSQIQQLEQQLQQVPGTVEPPIIPGQSQLSVSVPSVSVPPPTQPIAAGPGLGNIPNFPPPNFNQPPPDFTQPPPGFRQPPPTQFEYSHGQGAPVRPVVQEYNHGRSTTTPPPVPNGANILPPANLPTPGPGVRPPIPLPDLSKPPPGFPPLPAPANIPPRPPAPPPIPMVSEADLMPSVPYFELPAGLMAPLVKLEDCSYDPLDPKLIRLPPPMPPNERLLAAVEAFYSPPSHERPRDSEGWEKLGLFEFFKAKEKAKKLMEQEMKEKGIQKSRRSRSRSTSSSRSSSSSRSRSRTPPRRRWRERSRSRSPLPYRRTSRSKSRSRSRSRSRSPVSRRKSQERSPSPVFSAPFYATNTDTSLGGENKGHQLLKKMGWGGGGLGSSEQGITNPVEHAEVREKVDMFKGLGMANNDPFEQFRKSKSQGFVQRMKERVPTTK